ncbi:MAG: DUF4369 domain-containing protein [Flavobacterium sp.]|uniref:DUF4369 domain-containing protein n=1 Tax=Flavobacterium sp. TaxID=239 RepID=UPI0011F5E1BB|nr:DUF4369 domain-containing protein [Flavobacterium sp.]RZJ65298.1 MAG: DUF4369 domain-containing protein [Flavobacterium sp.]
MKKLIAATFAVLLFAACAKETKDGNLEISGNVEGLHKGTLFLKKFKDTALVTIDSISIDGDSKFVTYVNIDEPEALYLFLDRGKTNSIDNSLMFFAEPGKMKIDTKLETFYANAKVTGSENQKLYDDFKKVRSRFVNQQMDITKRVFEESMKTKTAGIPENDPEFQSVIKRKYLYVVNFALNNKDKEIAPFVALTEIPDATVKYLELIEKGMTPKIAKSKYGKLLTEYVAERKKAEDTVAAQ